ncbi:MAG TPA: argininosuccinate lyase [Candidatus Limiplasma sp.]|nr:argininosuccinate lyase [Candidatus Limiplasma sp.]HPS82136.1 argininosuccinate lyase [Candidatus Limiplasma sp.]
MGKLWAGRFEKPTSALLDDFQSSIPFDQRLLRCDLMGSVAHATMLGEQGIISAEDSAAIVDGLRAILADLEAGKLTVDMGAEDVHMFAEAELTARIGEAGKRLHTGRSRNDQVALDVRMYAKEACLHLDDLLRRLLETILTLAAQHTHTLMAGYTHLQKAQPVTLGFHLMAYFQMFKRDVKRFRLAYDEADVMPLGSGALAGTTYPLNRERVAELLDFSDVTDNAMDGVSDRDFLLSFLSAASICMMHLSRFCEELILWSTNEFGTATMDDAFATGSSIMPQKKNPDACELTRGKTGRVYGDLMTLLTVMKGLPLAYNKDMQEDKEAFFDAYDTLCKCLPTFTEMLATTAFNAGVMEKSAALGFTNATDLADYLVGKGLAFRDAHHVSGVLVAQCVREHRELGDLSLQELRAVSPIFENDVYDAISLTACVERRKLRGGPAPEAVEDSIRKARAWMETMRDGAAR